MIRNAIKENLRCAREGGEGTIPFRNALRAQISYSAELCREAVLITVEASGTSIHYQSNPVQRYLRDIMVMTSHIIMDMDVTMEQHGRSLLGLDPTTILV